MGWYEIFKDVLSMAQKADNVELVRQLLAMQKELQDMQQINFGLTRENMKLKELLSVQNQMQYDSEHNYYLAITDSSQKDGPFCPKCWDKDRKQARLAKFGYDLQCNVCRLVVGNENERHANEKMKSQSFFD